MERRRTFSREFKLEAVKLVAERGVTVAQAAKDLVVHEPLRSNAIRQPAEMYLMDTKLATTTPYSSPLYLFEKFEVGVIHLDVGRNVVAMNDFARKVLPVGEKQPFDKLVTSFHPDRSRPKVNFLLDQASGCPVASSTPMAMIINIPEQVLLIKVTRLGDHLGETTGFVLVFYDVTQVVSQERPVSEASATNLRLNRIPMVANHRVAFVDTQDVLSLESQAHYTRVLTRDGFHFCNLSIGDLQARLDPAQFMRVHRCFIVNLHAVAELGREGSKTYVVLKGKHREPVPVARGDVVRLREALGLLAKH